MAEKKFTKTWNVNDFEILTDTGYVDITALHETIPYKEYYIRTENGKDLKCADNHILFKDDFSEIYTADLKVGDIIMTDEGPSKVIYAEKNGFTSPMYDFELSINTNHRYYTNGILSHNTLLAKTISKLLDVNMVIVDSTVFTQAGYVGEDVESIISRLYQESGYDIEKTERGIVFIDEIDKIAKKGANPSITKDVSGEGVQQALLKLLEGSKVKIAPEGGRKHPEQPMVEIDTKNILFICSGAFVGIERQIGDRLNMRAVGFSNDTGKKQKNKDTLIQYITAEDVRSYGLIPELVGRLPIITHVDSLSKEALKKILIEPKNAIIKQYQKLLDMDGAKLVFTDDALDFIVDKAFEMKVGARALRSIVEEIMTQIMYDIPTTNKKKVVITKEYAEKMYNQKHAV
ncbi:MAG: hypothetical protein [Wendovervirus sonii]|uniref:Clp ATPase C-terminal domain-containing protein n=1 Tax=phage Lak_Megaphage_Sonny TaxID=3109229 RepID=A0ABZ0Z5Y1_9CAUD|nr:MAG: hypothetical protein [phage Lak_Megaphage_Sonny]